MNFNCFNPLYKRVTVLIHIAARVTTQGSINAYRPPTPPPTITTTAPSSTLSQPPICRRCYSSSYTCIATLACLCIYL